MSIEYAMNFEHLIFKEKPPDKLIRRLYFPAVNTRQQYISRSKARALAILASGDRSGAIASMLHDMEHWNEGKLYDAGELAMLRVEATFFMTTSEEIRGWINQFR